MNKFLMVGSDPECFLRDSQGQLVSAIELIPGSKESPYKTKNGSVQPDNITAEFNSKPASSLIEFIHNHRLIIKDLEEIVKPLDLHLDFVASVMAEPELLMHPDARKSGCDPDYCAWDLSMNIPAPYEGSQLRAAGGHLHISFDQAQGSDENRIKFVRALDLVLGVRSVQYDRDLQRRRFYGRAGSFRPKNTIPQPDYNNEGYFLPVDPYDGVEYRTLSNFWLSSEDFMAWAWEGVERVYNNLEELAEKANYYQNEIISIINSGDSDKSVRFCHMVGV